MKDRKKQTGTQADEVEGYDQGKVVSFAGDDLPADQEQPAPGGGALPDDQQTANNPGTE